jgi:Phage integrase, N-terminal SAM-like domain
VTSRRGRGEDSVYLDGNRWRGAASLGYGPDGRRIRKKVSGATKAEVLRKLRDLRSELNAGLPVPDDRVTVARFLERWLTARLPGQMSEKTLDSYADTVRLHITPSLGRKALRKLTVADVDQLLAWKRDAGYSANTVRIIRAVLRRALKQAEREGFGFAECSRALRRTARSERRRSSPLGRPGTSPAGAGTKLARGAVADRDAGVWAAAWRGVGPALVGSGLGVGHSSVAITKDVYGHLVEGQKRAAAARMSEALLAPNGSRNGSQSSPAPDADAG